MNKHLRNKTTLEQIYKLNKIYETNTINKLNKQNKLNNIYIYRIDK